MPSVIMPIVVMPSVVVPSVVMLSVVAASIEFQQRMVLDENSSKDCAMTFSTMPLIIMTLEIVTEFLSLGITVIMLSDIILNVVILSLMAPN